MGERVAAALLLTLIDRTRGACRLVEKTRNIDYKVFDRARFSVKIGRTDGIQHPFLCGVLPGLCYTCDVG